jgi:hypothetical protein
MSKEKSRSGHAAEIASSNEAGVSAEAGKGRCSPVIAAALRAIRAHRTKPFTGLDDSYGLKPLPRKEESRA